MSASLKKRRGLEHLSLIQTRVVTDRRTLVKDQSYCQKKKKVELKERVQQYLHSNRYFPVWKTVRETAHKHFYCRVTGWCCIEGDRFPSKCLCGKANMWQSELLGPLDLASPQEC